MIQRGNLVQPYEHVELVRELNAIDLNVSIAFRERARQENIDSFFGGIRYRGDPIRQ